MKSTISFLISLLLVLATQIVSGQNTLVSHSQQSLVFSSFDSGMAPLLNPNRPKDVSALETLAGFHYEGTETYPFENSIDTSFDDDVMRNSYPGVKRRGFRTNFMLGFPTGTESSFFKLRLALFAYYYVHLATQNITLFGGAGYTRFTGKELSDGFKTEGVGFLPLQVGIQYYLIKRFGIMGALGYAFGSQERINGLVYTVGMFYAINSVFNILLDYNGISVDGGSFNAISAGVEVDLGF